MKLLRFSGVHSTSCDADGFQMSPIVFIIDIIAPVLSYIFNLCFESGTFPSQMQIGRVVPIFKKEDKNDYSNYRPISLLPVLSKGLEKVLLNHLLQFTDCHNTISRCQHGFKKYFSTETAPLEQKEFILHEIENKKLVLALFIDFKKAFDSINYTILAAKAEKYGMRVNVLSIIRSYLSHRQQYVDVNGHLSRTSHIACGVPQKSI